MIECLICIIDFKTSSWNFIQSYETDNLLAFIGVSMYISNFEIYFLFGA